MTSQGNGASAETLAFMRQFRDLVQHLQSELGDDDGSESLSSAVSAHLGVDAAGLAVVTETVPMHRVVDADIALAELADLDPGARLVGIGGGDFRHHATFGDLLQMGRHGHGRIPVGQVDYQRLDTGPGADDNRQVVTSGVRLFAFDGSPVAVRVQGASAQFGRQNSTYEVVAVEREVSEGLIARLRELMDERSVMRGQVITFSGDPYGHGLAGLTFVARPTLSADEVVLPEGTLERIEHHVVGIGAARERLAAHGQHLKRGVLLFGPPGTGKTHTVRYLLSATPGTTAVLLSGGSLQHIATAAKVARAHQPSIVVLEDVDLVAEDRSIGFGPKPLLFEVLDALDGLDADADVAFLLTTNRVEDLEAALSQRPGRVDLAAEIPLPDREGRLALLRLYGGHLFGEDALAAAAERAEGTTASFAKELVRRAVLAAALEETTPADPHLAAALDELLSDAETLTRSLLGVAGGPDGLDGDPLGPDGVPGPGIAPHGVRRGRGQSGFGWFAYAPRG